MNLHADRLQQPIVQLGVTGHQFLEDIPTLSKACEKALNMVQELFSNRKIHLHSALSAGADHLVAEVALKKNTYPGRDLASRPGYLSPRDVS
jgi:hypothetical protein